MKDLLIIKLSSLGDVIHALPVAHAMKRGWPSIKITWVVEKPYDEILQGNKDIDHIVIFEKEKYKALLDVFSNYQDLKNKIRQYNIDVSFDLQGLFKSAIIAFASGAKAKFGYCDMREKSHWISMPIIGARRNGHVVERYLDVVRNFGYEVDTPVFNIPISNDEMISALEIANKHGLILDHKFLMIAPGANWQNKRWPTKYWAELVCKMAEMKVNVVMVGAECDREIADEIKSFINKPLIDLVGKTTIKELAALLKKTSAFVAGDTGPMHLAAALGVPTVAIMGPTDKVRNGPFGRGHKVVVAKRNCAGCWKRKCPMGYDCLNIVTVDDVYTMADTVLWHFESQRL